MKRVVSLLLATMLAVSVFSIACAETLEEWNASCSWIISGNATLYSRVKEEGSEGTGETYSFHAVGSLSSGTRVKLSGAEMDGKRQIVYWAGGQAGGWVDDGHLIWVGSEDDLNGKTPVTTDSAVTSRIQVNTMPGWDKLDVTLTHEDGATQPVKLITIGTAECLVSDGESSFQVPTAHLSWTTEAPEEKRLACIYAPKTGKCALRAKAKADSRTLAQCAAGSIVVVLKVGTSFSRVLYEGREGFVRTACLQYLVPPAPDTYTHAQLKYEGKTTGSATVAIFYQIETGCRIRQFRVGTEVVVLGEDKAWSIVEVGGLHGYVRTAYLEMPEEPAADTEAPAEMEEDAEEDSEESLETDEETL